ASPGGARSAAGSGITPPGSADGRLFATRRRFPPSVADRRFPREVSRATAAPPHRWCERRRRRLALFDRLAGLLPAHDAGRHDVHVPVTHLDRHTGGLVARVSLLVGAVEDERPVLVLGKVG